MKNLNYLMDHILCQIFCSMSKFMDFHLCKNMGKNIGKNISKSLNSKYSQKLLDNAKRSATGLFKTSSKRVIQKTAEAASDLIGNKIADKITGASKTSPKIFCSIPTSPTFGINGRFGAS